MQGPGFRAGRPVGGMGVPQTVSAKNCSAKQSAKRFDQPGGIMRRKAISLSKAGGLFLAGLTVRAVAFHPAPCVAPALGGDLPLGLGSRSAPRLRQTSAMSRVRRRAA